MAVGAATVLAWLPSGGAAAEPARTAAADGVRVHEAATTADEHRRIVDYWTRHRMRAAVPAERLVADRSKDSATGVVERGAPTVVGPTAKGQPGGAGFTGGYYTGGGEVTETTGKVFFTLSGTNYVCSGSSTSSANRDLVLTAGHCVHEGPGAYATNWAFVPGYDDGVRPFGTYTARQLVTTGQWASSGDFDYDVAFGVMNTLGGQHLTDTVGAQGIGFNLPRGEHMYSFGYPAARPYDGTDIAWCHAVVQQDTYGGSQDQGMSCNMTGGSSGGPWFIDYSEPSTLGTLNSVNSFGYRGVKDIMWGPYFGSVAQSLYGSASTL